jgi:flavin-binding protein dodecin
MVEFEIIERIGVSKKSVSDAVQNAIDNIPGDRNIHFFEIVQQRGKVDDNKNIEFQVILRIGIV